MRGVGRPSPILERLSLDTLAERRGRSAYGEIRDYAALSPRAPGSCRRWGRPRGYTTRLQRAGFRQGERISALVPDGPITLVQRHGFEQLLVYYRGFAAGRSRFENFDAILRQSLPDFEAEMVSRFGPGGR
jgi:hypothetical protein